MAGKPPTQAEIDAEKLRLDSEREALRARTKELIDTLSPAGLPPRDAVAIWGFLKEHPTDKNYWRLFLNMEFTEYIDFHDDYFIHEELLATTSNPLGGYMVWIERSAQVYYTTTVSRARQATFLMGALAEGNMPQEGAQSMPTWAGRFAPGTRQIGQQFALSPGCSGIPSCGGGSPCRV
jgi:hypothetical protein